MLCNVTAFIILVFLFKIIVIFEIIGNAKVEVIVNSLTVNVIL